MPHTEAGVAKTPAPTEATALDPTDWASFAALARRMLDDTLHEMQTVRERPVWRPVPPATRARFDAPMPERGIGAAPAYDEFLRDVRPFPVGNTHPRFWGWVVGSANPLGVMAELLSAAMNANVSGLRSSAALVEEQVIRWLTEMLGYPGEANGLLLSGASVANLVGLAVGVQARAGFDVGRDGWFGAGQRPVLYASTESHFSIEKAVRTLGLGTDALRRVPVDASYRIDLAVLNQAIARDRAAGHQPIALIGNAGTVNVGAFDDLDALADIAEREQMWFHVDGAFGAFAVLDPGVAGLANGMTRADSLAFDLHKWMVVPIEAGAVLIRDPEAHRAAFAVSGSYVSNMPGGIGQDATAFAERGLQLTRGFKALKVWLSLKAYGVAAYRALVRENVVLARYLAEGVRGAPDLELLAPVPLNVVNFRFRTEALDTAALNDLNRDLVVRLQETGVAAPSHTVLDGQFSIRVCITNHRTARDDLDALVAATLTEGRALLRSRQTQ